VEISMKMIHSSILLLVAVSFCTPATAQCPAPHFHIGQDFSNPQQGIGSLSVSLRPKDFTVQKLSCLCQKLLKKNPKWERAGVEFFTTREAAGNMSHMLTEPPPEAKRWEREYHASYSFDKSKRQNQFAILPLGLRGPASLNTTIDLPLTTAPHCQLEIGSRCLMAALEEIDYPQEALKVRAGGKVTVAGVIDRDGGVRKIQVVSTDAQPNDGSALANAALHDLGTWRFDSGDRDDPIEIVYSFVISAPAPFNFAETRVNFFLPNKVEIQRSSWRTK
jgi:hypothetical protein